MPNPRCAARAFCACFDCRTFSYDTTGGNYRGPWLSIPDERDRVKARRRVPTHRRIS